MKFALFVFAPVAGLVMLLSAPDVHADYSTGGWARATAPPHNINNLDEEAAHPYSSNDAVADGVGGSHGEAHYYASLYSASVGVYAQAIAGTSATGKGDAQGSFRDVLHFTVPAGYYQQGVTLTLHGSLSGTLTGTTSAQSGGITLSGVFSVSDDILTDTFDVLYTTAGTYAESFQVQSELVAPDTTLLTPTLVSRNVYGMLRCNLMAPNHPDSVEGNFFNTASFHTVEVPIGVTYTSDSGAFLIPEPTSFALLALGLLGLARYRARRG